MDRDFLHRICIVFPYTFVQHVGLNPTADDFLKELRNFIMLSCLKPLPSDTSVLGTQNNYSTACYELYLTSRAFPRLAENMVAPCYLIQDVSTPLKTFLEGLGDYD